MLPTPSDFIGSTPTHSVHMHSFLESIIVQEDVKNQLQDIALCGLREPYKVFLLVVSASRPTQKKRANLVAGEGVNNQVVVV